MIEEFTHATFSGRVGQAFQICPNGAKPTEVVLIEATAYRRQPGAGRREPFSLIFRGPRESWLPQQIYPMRHEELGGFELFLVPIGPDGEGMRYEAVFN